jgi:uncharacterized protein YndB with AHSA1/START domain
MAAKSELAPTKIETPEDDKLVITRTFDAPRSLVWRAWTQPQHLMKWSCPQECSMLLAEGDLRVGGKWRVGMREPDGEDAFMHGEYLEIEEPSRLVYTHGWEDSKLHPGHMTQVSVQLFENNGQTTMIFTQTKLPTVASRDGHGEGWSSAFESLAKYLESLA